MASTRLLAKLVTTVGQISSGAVESYRAAEGQVPTGLEVVPRLLRLVSETLSSQSQLDEASSEILQRDLILLIQRYGTCRRAIDALANRSRKHQTVSLDKARAWSQGLSVTSGAIVPTLKRHGTLFVSLNKWVSDAGPSLEESLDAYQVWLDGPLDGDASAAFAVLSDSTAGAPSDGDAVREAAPVEERSIDLPEYVAAGSDDIRLIRESFLADKHPGEDPEHHLPSKEQAAILQRLEAEDDAHAHLIVAIVKRDFAAADAILQHVEGKIDATDLLILRGDRLYMESRFDEALRWYREARTQRDDLTNRLNLAVTLIRAQRGVLEDNFKEATDLLTSTLEGLPDGSVQWARVQSVLGAAWAHCPGGSKDVTYARAIQCYNAALTAFEQSKNPHWWAETHHHLGNVLSGMPTGDRAENVNAALQHFDHALEAWTKDDHPQRWASVHNSLGHAWERYPKGNRPANMERAIMCYSAACEVCTKQSNPALWARLQNNLGNAWIQLPVGDHRQNVERAIACHTAALEVWSQLQRRSDWAATQNNLGNAWALLPVKGEERERNLRRAISCYKASLDVRTRSTLPAEWAATLNNMGSAHLHLKVARNGMTIKEAIECFTRALEVRTRQEYPVEWAKTQANLGHAWSKQVLGDRMENLHEAIAYYECALEVLTEAQHPHQHRHIRTRMNEARAELQAIEKR